MPRASGNSAANESRSRRFSRDETERRKYCGAPQWLQRERRENKWQWSSHSNWARRKNAQNKSRRSSRFLRAIAIRDLPQSGSNPCAGVSRWRAENRLFPAKGLNPAVAAILRSTQKAPANPGKFQGMERHAG